MIRKIIHIDTDKCNGCGVCTAACHEGAIVMVSGKATLLRDDYCDGLGDCLPVCPTNAITFIEREAAAYDEAAVKAAKSSLDSKNLHNSCPGSSAKKIERSSCNSQQAEFTEQPSQLAQWPIQIKLVPVKAPYFNGAKLLIAADCTAYSYASFHTSFMQGHITIIGCPKLDSIEYAEKLTALIQNTDIKSVTVVRMEVPCCGGLEKAAASALQASNKSIPLKVVTITTAGEILN